MDNWYTLFILKIAHVLFSDRYKSLKILCALIRMNKVFALVRFNTLPIGVVC